MTYGKLVISCGGTGGHFFPGLATARELNRLGGEALLLLSGMNSVRQREIAEAFGVRAVVLPPMPSPGRNPLKIFRFLSGLIRGMFRSYREIAAFRPDAALGMGSFASLPVLLAAWRAKVPIYLHDGNARIGRANRYLSRIAVFLGTAFPAVNADRVHCPVECTGMPLRRELLEAASWTREAALAELNRRHGTLLLNDLRTILIFGGSQGAATLNEQVPQAIFSLGSNDFQVIHLTGPKNYEHAKSNYEKAPFPVLVLPGSDAMEILYSAADLVISRSGGSTAAELLLFGKSALLVPYPYAAENHQWDNARYLVKCGAAQAIDNADCGANRVAQWLTAFGDDIEGWAERAKRAKQFARPDAANALLDRIFPAS
ncbi:MAG: glycosyltransferase [Victivallaceae bacterium]